MFYNDLLSPLLCKLQGVMKLEWNVLQLLVFLPGNSLQIWSTNKELLYSHSTDQGNEVIKGTVLTLEASFFSASTLSV